MILPQGADRVRFQIRRQHIGIPIEHAIANALQAAAPHQLRDRNVEAALARPGRGLRHAKLLRQFAQHIFRRPFRRRIQQRNIERAGQVHHAPVENGNADFEAMRHAHRIDLCQHALQVESLVGIQRPIQQFCLFCLGLRIISRIFSEWIGACQARHRGSVDLLGNEFWHQPPPLQMGIAGFAESQRKARQLGCGRKTLFVAADRVISQPTDRPRHAAGNAMTGDLGDPRRGVGIVAAEKFVATVT